MSSKNLDDLRLCLDAWYVNTAYLGLSFDFVLSLAQTACVSTHIDLCSTTGKKWRPGDILEANGFVVAVGTEVGKRRNRCAVVVASCDLVRSS